MIGVYFFMAKSCHYRLVFGVPNYTERNFKAQEFLSSKFSIFSQCTQDSTLPQSYIIFCYSCLYLIFANFQINTFFFFFLLILALFESELQLAVKQLLLPSERTIWCACFIFLRWSIVWCDVVVERWQLN